MTLRRLTRRIGVNSANERTLGTRKPARSLESWIFFLGYPGDFRDPFKYRVLFTVHMPLLRECWIQTDNIAFKKFLLSAENMLKVFS